MTPRLALRAAPERTLESLYRRHAADVYRYALMMLASAPDAEDVTQTTFLNAYRALLRGERPRASGPWLQTIAHNLCLQHVRQAARRPRQVELEDEVATLVSEPQGLLVEDLTRALGHIPAQQRTALLMRELEGRPLGEIASVLGTSTSAVETLLFRARRALREQLEGGVTCAEVEQMISRQLDGQLGRAERGKLRAHLRECEECTHVARSMRATRGALKSLALIPLPGALAWSRFASGVAASGVAGGGAISTGGLWFAGTVASKLVGATVLAIIAAGTGYLAAVKHPWSASARVPVPARVSGIRVDDHAASPAARPANVVGRRVVGKPSTSAPRTRVNAARKSERTHRSRATAGAPAPSNHSAPARGPAAAAHPGPPAHGVASGRGRHTTPPPHPSHPAKPAHPSHPAKPARPSHPAKPAHPSPPAKPAHSHHPAKSPHPNHPAKPPHPTPQSNPTHAPNPNASQHSHSVSSGGGQAGTAAASLPSTSP